MTFVKLRGISNNTYDGMPLYVTMEDPSSRIIRNISVAESALNEFGRDLSRIHSRDSPDNKPTGIWQFCRVTIRRIMRVEHG